MNISWTTALSLSTLRHITGIGVGVIVPISLVGGFCFWRRRQDTRHEAEAPKSLNVEQYSMPQPIPYYDHQIHKNTLSQKCLFRQEQSRGRRTRNGRELEGMFPIEST